MILPAEPAAPARRSAFCPACQGVTEHERILGAWVCTAARYHAILRVYADGVVYEWDTRTGEQVEITKAEPPA